MAENSPLNTPRTDGIFPTPNIGSESGNLPSSAQPFSSFMKSGASPMETAGKAPMVSPFDLMQSGRNSTQTPTLATLNSQVNQAQSTLGDLNTQLNTPNLKLKASQKYLLRNKLSDANANLRGANARLGAPIPDEPPASQFSGPLGKFLGYLTDGQAQLASAQQQLSSLSAKGKKLSPGDFLLIQVKINKAQQELEFSSVLLSNAVSSIKTLMQVQL